MFYITKLKIYKACVVFSIVLSAGQAHATPMGLLCPKIATRSSIPLRFLDSAKTISFGVSNFAEVRGVEEISHLKLMTFNIRHFTGEKNSDRVREIILAENPDIATLQEIVSPSKLGDIVGDRYNLIYTKGNETSEGQIVFIVKKDLPFHYNLISFTSLTRSTSGFPLFPRDLPVLVLRLSPGGKPFLMLAGNHLKSLAVNNGQTPEHVEKVWLEQFSKSLNIFDELKARFGSPMVWLGDFNRPMPTVLDRLQKSFRDVFSVKKLSGSERETHYMRKGGEVLGGQQLDGVLISPDLVSSVEDAGVYRSGGEKYDFLINVSDHRPVTAVLSTNGLKGFTAVPAANMH